MSRYVYLGPYDMIEIEGKRVNRNSEVDIDNDAFVDDLTQRGYQIFNRVDPSAVVAPPPEPAEVVPEPVAEIPAEEPAAP